MHLLLRNIQVRTSAIELLLLHAIDEEVVATAVEHLEPILRPDAPEHAVVDYADSVAEHVGLLHRVGCQDHCTVVVLFTILQDVP